MTVSSVDIHDVPATEVMPGMRGRFVHTDSMTFAYWDVEEGARLPEHAHPHEQVVNVLEGEFELTVDGEVLTLTAGSVVPIPSNVPHSGRALSDARILDVFQPVRDDYRFDGV